MAVKIRLNHADVMMRMYHRREVEKHRESRRKKRIYNHRWQHKPFSRDPMRRLLIRQGNKRIRRQAVGKEIYGNYANYKKAIDYWRWSY